MEKDRERFCQNLKALRGAMPQGEFATIIGVKQTTYSAWENGKSEPDISKICAIVRNFGITADKLLGLSGLPSAGSPPDRTKELKKKIEAILKEY